MQTNAIGIGEMVSGEWDGDEMSELNLGLSDDGRWVDVGLKWEP